ncbi:RecA-superfamily ATPase, KaiC/GvpD/RAD55 family [Haloplanus vescus]|uniref:RecA-superfamily ATPase, KaiC/GvpD/RAD55 family n=1 Tax=Haloplanus vescus TaxID=555874 RepID=A0A1H3WF25_9EURY|nr:hypothetical protein [Haloplanus vescus]SDZ84994.1 RecA-superfamily ATPase, KaiC/GvpD/RAD55 family [Haloplanus vescus]
MADGDAQPGPYPVSDALPAGVDELDPGLNVLVSGPSMSGKRQLVFDLLAPDSDAMDPVVVMTTDDPAQRIQTQLGDRGVSFAPDAVRVVDATGAPGDDDPAIHRVNSPADLTGMGVAFTQAVEQMGTPDRLRLGFLSISTLLQYVDSERTFSFMHVLSRRTSAAGYLGVFTLDPSTHDEQFVNVVTSIFDVVIELRETDGDRELRVRGLPGVDTSWTDFPH